jgi:hypothetical protein
LRLRAQHPCGSFPGTVRPRVTSTRRATDRALGSPSGPAQPKSPRDSRPDRGGKTAAAQEKASHIRVDGADACLMSFGGGFMVRVGRRLRPLRQRARQCPASPWARSRRCRCTRGRCAPRAGNAGTEGRARGAVRWSGWFPTWPCLLVRVGSCGLTNSTNGVSRNRQSPTRISWLVPGRSSPSSAHHRQICPSAED